MTSETPRPCLDVNHVIILISTYFKTLHILYALSSYICSSKKNKTKSFYIIIAKHKYNQWRSQEFRLGGVRLKDKIGNKKLI